MVAEAAARNKKNGKEIELFLDRCGDQVTITEEVLEAAAGNEREWKKR